MVESALGLFPKQLQIFGQPLMINLPIPQYANVLGKVGNNDDFHDSDGTLTIKHMSQDDLEYSRSLVLL
jgi:hypothetical protein